MLNRLKEIETKLKKYLPAALLGLSSSCSTPATPHTPLNDSKIEKTEKVSNSTNTIKSTNNNRSYKFSSLPENNNYADSSNTTYVINAERWRKSGEVEIKRVSKNHIYNYDLTTVMQKREGPSGDIVNINKLHTRILTCQANVVAAKQYLLYMYCSGDKDMEKFASKYIPQTPKNKELKQQVYSILHDENGELKTGPQASRERSKTLQLMYKKIPVAGIANGNRFSQSFLQDLKEFDKNHHDKFLQSQKDYVVGIYPIFNSKNIPAQKANEYAQKNNLRNASCIPIGIASLNTSSLIAYGAYSSGTLTKEASTVRNAKEINKVDYITLETARQLAIAGYKGGDELYKVSLEKINENNHKNIRYQIKSTSMAYVNQLNELNELNDASRVEVKTQNNAKTTQNKNFQIIRMKKNNER